MTTTRLAKEYAKLTPAERFPLIVAASLRGDDVEYHRLRDSAPTVAFTTPDTFGLAMAFREVAEYHRMELLTIAGNYLRILALTDGHDDDKLSKRLYDSALFFGFLFSVNRDGWRLFCKGLTIDPDALVSVLPGSDLLARASELSAHAAFTAEGALAYAREKWGTKEDAAPTADSVAAALRDTLDSRVEWWG